LIPHYKTLKMTQLCLRLIKSHTDLERVEIIVEDNGSKDESSEYLKKLDWISLITREKVIGESGAQSHSNALNLALERVSTPYVLSIIRIHLSLILVG